jgi:tripartite-type tricarboxylate transporter receptor subunit TctC
MRRRITRTVFSLATSIALAGSALAQDWPARPVTLIVPSSAGGTPDVLGRVLGQKLAELLGQQVLVVDRPGASGNIGSEAVARASPDGYTLLFGSIVNTTNPHMMKVNFALEELTPVSSVAAAPDVLTVMPTTPARTFSEFVAWLKANPGASAAIPGFGSTPHLSLETFRRMSGTSVTVVPYQGGGQVLQGLLSGQVPFAFVTTVAVMPRLRSGQMIGLAVTSARRIAALPDLPTVAESGLPGFEVAAWFGVFAPAGTPKPIVDRLSAEIRKAVAAPEVRQRLIDLGAEPLGSTPEEFSAFVKSEYARWGVLIKEAGIKAR